MELILLRKASGSKSSMHLASLASSTTSLSALLHPCWKEVGLFIKSSKGELEGVLANPTPMSLAAGSCKTLVSPAISARSCEITSASSVGTSAFFTSTLSQPPRHPGCFLPKKKSELEEQSQRLARFR